MTASVHARGIVIAGALAALALALGFVTLAMNQTASQAAPRVIVPLKDRHHSTSSVAAAHKTAVAKKKVAAKPNVNLVAALKAGLPRDLATALAKHSVVVVELSSKLDPVDTLAAGEAKAGAALAGAGYLSVNVDIDGGSVSALTTALGKLPASPAVLVYARPATLITTLEGFNDRTAVLQAATSASSTRAASAT